MKTTAALIVTVLALSACSKEEAPKPASKPDSKPASTAPVAAPAAAPAPAPTAPADAAPPSTATPAPVGGTAPAEGGAAPIVPVDTGDPEKPIVKVNDKTIYRKDILGIVDGYCQRLEGGCPDEASQKKVVQFVVDQMIAMALVDQQSQKDNITVTPEEVDARITEVSGQIGGPEQLQAMLTQAGKTMEQFKTEITSDVRRRKFVQGIQDKATKEGKDPQKALEEAIGELQKTAKIEQFP